MKLSLLIALGAVTAINIDQFGEKYEEDEEGNVYQTEASEEEKKPEPKKSEDDDDDADVSEKMDSGSGSLDVLMS